LPLAVAICSAFNFPEEENEMADEHRPRRRHGEAFWWAHHEAWKRSDLNQRQYCEAQGIPLKAFGNWRAKFMAEPQPPVRKLLYRRGDLSHTRSHPVPTANPTQLTDACESSDSSVDERSLQVVLLRFYRPVPVAGFVGSRNTHAPDQLNVLRRSSQKRVPLSRIDRLLLVGLYRLAFVRQQSGTVANRRRLMALRDPAPLALEAWALPSSKWKS
jgi:hypothetical protein